MQNDLKVKYSLYSKTVNKYKNLTVIILMNNYSPLTQNQNFVELPSFAIRFDSFFDAYM